MRRTTADPSAPLCYAQDDNALWTTTALRLAMTTLLWAMTMLLWAMTMLLWTMTMLLWTMTMLLWAMTMLLWTTVFEGRRGYSRVTL